MTTSTLAAADWKVLKHASKLLLAEPKITVSQPEPMCEIALRPTLECWLSFAFVAASSFARSRCTRVITCNAWNMASVLAFFGVLANARLSRFTS